MRVLHVDMLICLVRSGLVCSVLVWSVLVWSGLVWSGLVWSGLDLAGTVQQPELSTWHLELLPS